PEGCPVRRRPAGRRGGGGRGRWRRQARHRGRSGSVNPCPDASSRPSRRGAGGPFPLTVPNPVRSRMHRWPHACIMRGHLFIRIQGYSPMSSYLFTSESVSEGQPDKIADQTSDAVLDAILAQDKRARVACETLVKTGAAIVAGEVTTSAWVDIEGLARKVINDIGYNNSD